MTNTLRDYTDNIKAVERPTWDEYFLELAHVISKRSLDANTKHGCVFVDEKNRIVSTGYNSFPPGFPDKQLPNWRKQDIEPDCPKYDFMVHAEANAISNLITKNYQSLTCYLTGIPCVPCLRLMIGNNVKRIVISTTKCGWQFTNSEKPAFDELVHCSGIKLETLNMIYCQTTVSEYNWVYK